MTFETYFAFLLFVIVMTGTPGAGNLSMMAIGQTTGYRSSLPFLCGMVVGMTILDTMAAFGLAGVLLAWPEAAWAMKIIGMAYILYLAWKIVSMQLSETKVDRRFTFVEGLFLHPTNPKSWAMSVVGFSQIATVDMEFKYLVPIFVLTFFFAGLFFHSLWGLAGSYLMRTLKSRSVLVSVNLALVTLMIGATAYALFI